MDVEELRCVIADAGAAGMRLQLRGGGTKDGVGAPCPAACIVDLSRLSGIVDYDPPELVLTARAGTPLSVITALLAAHDQMLAFDPWDPAALFGGTAGAATIGGIVAAGQSGSQRLTQGAVRDHLLGFTAISGRAESFVAGAKVVKNVTGYDLPKLMAGSWGRLGAMTEITLKVLPRPLASLTAIARGLSAREAWQAMARHLRSAAEVVAAAHAPAGALGPTSMTALRVQGFAPSVEARCQMIETVAGDDPRFNRVDEGGANEFWDAFRTFAPLKTSAPLWRVSLPARRGADFLDQTGASDREWLMDWAGGLIWYAGDCEPARLRASAAALGGHAMLMRGGKVLRTATPAFHPLAPPVAALEQRVRSAFDPAGIFDTGRF